MKHKGVVVAHCMCASVQLFSHHSTCSWEESMEVVVSYSEVQTNVSVGRVVQPSGAHLMVSMEYDRSLPLL